MCMCMCDDEGLNSERWRMENGKWKMENVIWLRDIIIIIIINHHERGTSPLRVQDTLTDGHYQ